MRIGFFDSGIGGITTLRACRAILPCCDYIYYADDLNAPYGNLSADEIVRHVDAAADKIFNYGVSALVIACNTATSAGVQHLREKTNIPVIGIEPALAPALRENKDGEVLLLCTNATARLPKLSKLIESLNTDRIRVLPLGNFATLIEQNINNLSYLRTYIAATLQPYPDISAIVLGCTHYCFVKDIIKKLHCAPIYDGNDGVARRLKANILNEGGGNVKFILSSNDTMRQKLYYSLII